MEFLNKTVIFKFGNDFYIGKAISYNKNKNTYMIDKPMNLKTWHELRSNLGHKTEKDSNLLKLYAH